MRQIQVTVPKEHGSEIEEVLQEYSTDITSNEAEKEGDKVLQFVATVEEDQIDDITKDLKAIKEINVGKLSIRVLEQETLIKKGQKTRGSSSVLSQEEIYSKAQQFSGLAGGEWALIALSSAIAVYGLALDNVAVVVGAMMVAPILSPFVSGAVSLAVGDKTLMISSVKSGVLASAMAVLVAFIAIYPFPVSMNSTIMMIVSPGIPMIILSFLVGAAAAFTYATGFRDQIAGVAVAIALVPPLAASGLALKMADFDMALKAASIAFINILAVIIAGYSSFRLLGLSPNTYYKERTARKIRYAIPVALALLFMISAPITYSSMQGADGYMVQQNIESQANSFFEEDLIDVENSREGLRVIVVGDHNETEFKKELSQNAKVKVIELQRIEN